MSLTVWSPADRELQPRDQGNDRAYTPTNAGNLERGRPFRKKNEKLIIIVNIIILNFHI